MLRTLLGLALLYAVLVMPTAEAAPIAQWEREGWKTDFSRTIVDLDEVRSGGPPRDGIPSIDDPQFVPVSEVSDLQATEPVIALEIDGDARAYPLSVMTFHEIVNDRFGERPILVTYCPLCNAAIVFDARVKGEAASFGTTGKLRRSDLVMYDRATDSWWQQFTGEGIAGVHAGERLKMLPSRLASWAEFREAHPDGRVLVPNDPNMRPYGTNPYAGYDTAARPFLYDGALPDDIDPMARVVVVRRGEGAPLVVSLARLREEPFEADGLRIAWRAGQASALDDRRIARGRDVGGVVVTEDGAPVVHDVTFAFVAHAFHPEAPILR
ncbi:MAG: DUF3179 domain-containing protein [Pseudomonadota bacterium]